MGSGDGHGADPLSTTNPFGGQQTHSIIKVCVIMNTVQKEMKLGMMVGNLLHLYINSPWDRHGWESVFHLNLHLHINSPLGIVGVEEVYSILISLMYSQCVARPHQETHQAVTLICHLAFLLWLHRLVSVRFTGNLPIQVVQMSPKMVYDQRELSASKPDKLPDFF